MKSRAYDTLVAGFRTTRWELITEAAEGSSEAQEEALEALCSTYWAPVYAFIRRKGQTRADSQDLTQEFLLHLVRGSMLKELKPEKGRFRSYLAACCKHFLSNHRDAAKAIKRGGGFQFLSLDFEAAEIGYQSGLVNEVTPETEFDRSWASMLMAETLKHLEEDYREDGKAAIFSALQPILLGEGNQPNYRELAVQLQTSEANVQVMVHRLRKKFSDLLREEIKATVVDPSEVDDELRHLIAVLS